MKILATPVHQLGTPYLGVLRPEYVVDGNVLVKADPHDFPNRGLVFMPSSFDEMTREYPEEESLVAIDIEVNEQSSVQADDPNYAKYITSKGKPWSEPARWLMQQVIDGRFDPSDRQLVLPTTPHHPIWIRDESGLYGPFDTTSRTQEDGTVLVTLRPPDVIPWNRSDRPDYAIMRYSAHALEVHTIGDREYILQFANTFERKPFTWVDFIPDESLINWVRTRIGGSGEDFTKRQADHVKYLLRENLAEEDANEFAKERVERAVKLLERVEGWHEQRAHLVREYLDTPEGNEQMAQLAEAGLENNIDRFVSHHHPKIIERINYHSKRAADLAGEVEDLRTELNDLQAIDKEALERKRDEMESDLKEKREELAAIREQLAISNDVQDLRVLHEDLSTEVRSLRADAEELQELTTGLEALRNELREEASRDFADLRTRLASVKPYLDVLTGASTPAKPQHKLPAVRVTTTPPEDLQTLARTAHKGMEAFGHDISGVHVANTLTSLLTSPLTILAGLPGVGKTSMISRLAQAMGMTNRTQFLTVRVPRGWRNRHDVLGYNNPITGEYDPAPTGLYPYLQHHDAREESVPGWILFDEANLSPPEHYMSDFLPMMDETADRTLATGRPGELLHVPPHLRFVYTINQDHSVEPLTPRVLDRAAVVYVAPPETFDTNDHANRKGSGLDGTLTSRMVDDLLSRIDRDLASSEEATLEDVIRVLHDTDTSLGTPTRVSPRKYQRTLTHTSTLRSMLGVNAGLTALDYAVATHLLPLIRGSGRGYRARLDQLAAHLDSLPHSRTLLERIVATGEDAFDEYSFQTIT